MQAVFIQRKEKGQVKWVFNAAQGSLTCLFNLFRSKEGW